MRTYRVGGTMTALLGWNGMAVPAILGLIALAPESTHDEQQVLYAIAGLLGLLGPVALIAYWIRYLMVRVEMGPAGVGVSNRYTVPWSEIRAVRLRGWRPGPWNPFERVEMSGCTWLLLFLFCKIVILGLLVVLLVWILRVVVLPVAVLYSPWHSRVVVDLADGSKLVYRDLNDAEEFVWSANQRLETASTGRGEPTP